jgi:hypothetical protein
MYVHTYMHTHILICVGVCVCVCVCVCTGVCVWGVCVRGRVCLMQWFSCGLFGGFFVPATLPVAFLLTTFVLFLFGLRVDRFQLKNAQTKIFNEIEFFFEKIKCELALFNGIVVGNQSVKGLHSTKYSIGYAVIGDAILNGIPNRPQNF